MSGSLFSCCRALPHFKSRSLKPSGRRSDSSDLSPQPAFAATRPGLRHFWQPCSGVRVRGGLCRLCLMWLQRLSGFLAVGLAPRPGKGVGSLAHVSHSTGQPFSAPGRRGAGRASRCDPSPCRRVPSGPAVLGDQFPLPRRESPDSLRAQRQSASRTGWAGRGTPARGYGLPGQNGVVGKASRIGGAGTSTQVVMISIRCPG